MKKIIFVCVCIVTVAVASAQSKVRLNGYGSYVFDDGFDVYNDANTYYSGKIKAGAQWGAGIEYLTNPYFSVEVMYLNKSSDVPSTFKFQAGDPVRTETFKLQHDYLLLALNGLKPSSSGKVEGYFGFLLGCLFSNVESPTNHASDSNTDFTWGGKLGLNYWMSEKFGIKIQSQILTAAKVTGGGTYWGYWGPIYVNEYSTMWQFGLGGGLTFKLGK